MEGGPRLNTWCPSLCSQRAFGVQRGVVSGAGGAVSSEDQVGFLDLPRESSVGGVLLRCREVLEGWDEGPRGDGRPHWALNLVRDQELFSLWASVCPSVKWEARVHDLQPPSPSCAPIPPSPGQRAHSWALPSTSQLKATYFLAWP